MAEGPHHLVRHRQTSFVTSLLIREVFGYLGDDLVDFHHSQITVMASLSLKITMMLEAILCPVGNCHHVHRFL